MRLAIIRPRPGRSPHTECVWLRNPLRRVRGFTARRNANATKLRRYRPIDPLLIARRVFGNSPHNEYEDLWKQRRENDVAEHREKDERPYVVYPVTSLELKHNGHERHARNADVSERIRYEE